MLTLGLVPIASSQSDPWAPDGALVLVARNDRHARVVLNRTVAGIRLAKNIATAAHPIGAG